MFFLSKIKLYSVLRQVLGHCRNKENLQLSFPTHKTEGSRIKCLGSGEIDMLKKSIF